MYRQCPCAAKGGPAVAAKLSRNPIPQGPDGGLPFTTVASRTGTSLRLARLPEAGRSIPFTR